MGRMKDVAIDIENLLNAGMSEKDIATKTGMPIEQVREVKKYSGGGGGGGMNPADIEKVPGKRPLKMKKGGVVRSSASKRADGIAIRGKTRA